MRSLSRRSPIVGRGYDLAVQACGPLACNMYTLICKSTGDAAVVDPSFQNPFEFDTLLKHFHRLEDESGKSIQMKHILLTHGHPDHVCGVVETLKIWPGAKLHLHPLEEENYRSAPEVALQFGLHLPLQAGHTSLPSPTDELYDGQTLSIGSTIRLDVVHTPGHAPGHVAFVDDRGGRRRLDVENSESSNNGASSSSVDDGLGANDDTYDTGDKNQYGNDGAVIISGDLLFQGSVGRTDFPNASMDDLNASLRRLYELYDNDDTHNSTTTNSNSIVLSGHTTPTSLDRERTSNPFVQLALKRPIEWYHESAERHEWVRK